METHVALSSGVTSMMVDHQTAGTQATAKVQEDVKEQPKDLGDASFANQNFERNALLAPVSERGSVFDLLM